MCYASSVKSGPGAITKAFGVTFPDSEKFRPAFSASAFSFPLMPVISSHIPDAVSLYRWGLIPFWVKSWEQGSSIREKTINARCETVFEKPAFKYSMREKRCLVIVDGFYEWRDFDGSKYPYYIRLKDRTIFALAGIWDTWINSGNGEEFNTFSIITTKANELVAKVHNVKKRMPVILSKHDETRWLDMHLDVECINSIMQPYSASEMEAYPVSKNVYKLGYNTTNETVTKQFVYPGLPSLD